MAASSPSSGVNRPAAYHWHYDDTGYYAYVLVDGDRQMCDVLCRRLQVRGVGCLAKGPSRRPASDGRIYDFYIRVGDVDSVDAGAGGRESSHPSRVSVYRAFSGLPQFGVSETAPEDLPPARGLHPGRAGSQTTGEAAVEVSGESARLRKELSLARAQSSEKDAALRRAASMLDQVRRSRKKLRDELISLRESYEKEFERLRPSLEARPGEQDEADVAALAAQTRASKGRVEELSAELAARDSEIAELNQVWAEAEKNADLVSGSVLDLENRLYSMGHERSGLREEVFELREQLRRVDPGNGVPANGSAPGVSSRQVEELYGRLISYLAPSLKLERGSVALVATEFRENKEALSAVDSWLTMRTRREDVLKKRLANLEGYDFVILDTAPTFSLLNLNALAYAEEIWMPVNMEYMALSGVRQVLDNMRIVREEIGHDVAVRYVIPTFVDRRNSKTTSVLQALEESFGPKVTTPVRSNVRLSEAPSHHQSIYDYAPGSAGAEDYRTLTRRILQDG